MSESQSQAASPTAQIRCGHDVPLEFCGSCRTPRWKNYLSALWCTAFDWTDGLSRLYRSDKRGPLVWLGVAAQRVWFRAHNNRIYNWLDEPHDTLCRAVYPGAAIRPVHCTEVRGHRGKHSGEQYLDWDDATEISGWTGPTIGVWTSSAGGGDA